MIQLDITNDKIILRHEGWYIRISFQKVAVKYLTRGIKFPSEKLSTYFELKHFEKAHFPLLSCRIYTLWVLLALIASSHRVFWNCQGRKSSERIFIKSARFRWNPRVFFTSLQNVAEFHPAYKSIFFSYLCTFSFSILSDASFCRCSRAQVPDSTLPALSCSSFASFIVAI